MDDFEEPMHIRIRDVNPHIVCSLCAGYFIDATTITECLHTFCKSCIVKYLQNSKSCPQCNVKVHETQPVVNLRPDRTLQDIVYKLVPGLFKSEEKRREEFYRSRGLSTIKKEGDEVKTPKLSSILNHPQAHLYKFDEQICLCLDRYRNQVVDYRGRAFALPLLEKKFIRCSIRVLVTHLKHMLYKKLNLPEELKLDILCRDEKMGDEVSMKQIYLMYWQYQDMPVNLFYRFHWPDLHST